MERQIEDFKLVEKDRDGALEDARKWKAQFERLDEALRLLTQQIRRPPSSSANEKVAGQANSSDHQEGFAEEKKEVNPEETSQNHPTDHIVETNSSLLDAELDEDQDIADFIDVPGTYFSALSNACQQQRESLRLASVEANSAIEDLHATNEKLGALQKRMEKAEKQIVKLWEENCGIRQNLKQKKREKRVLVREVKALQQSLLEEQARTRRSPVRPHQEEAMADTIFGSDDERLIVELEEHVASSIRLHERLLTGGSEVQFGTEGELNTSIEGSEDATSCGDAGIASNCATLQFDTSSISEYGGRLSPLQPKVLSLFDDDSGATSDDDEVVEDGSQAYPPSISSVGAELGEPVDCDGSTASAIHLNSVHSGSQELPNPIFQLDDESCEQPPNLCAASTQSASSKSVITENGRATSRLVCPLADVVETREADSGQIVSGEDLQVYHLTFYSQKIGIQFQRAPPAPSKPKGLLTEAIKADLIGDRNGSGKSAKELSKIANFSKWAKPGRDWDGQEVCQLSEPKDIVLVCGFQGFDDEGNNRRPKLGARLVAFDGISVEVGNWTFDSVRKAIKARGRPMTLSFRNDFLTTEQRSILTKAVREVETSAPPPRRTIQYHTHIDRPPSTTPSINSAISHESDCFVNDGDHGHNDEDLSAEIASAASRTCLDRRRNLHNDDDQDLSMEVASAASGKCLYRRNSSNQYGSSHQSQSRRPSGALNRYSGVNFLSLRSETLFIILAMSGAKVDERTLVDDPASLKERKLDWFVCTLFAPESLSNTPQHQDFQSNLL